MPLYEYKCTDCSNNFEILQNSYRNTEVFCPDCGAEAEKLFLPAPGSSLKDPAAHCLIAVMMFPAADGKSGVINRPADISAADCGKELLLNNIRMVD